MTLVMDRSAEQSMAAAAGGVLPPQSSSSAMAVNRIMGGAGQQPPPPQPQQQQQHYQQHPHPGAVVGAGGVHDLHGAGGVHGAGVLGNPQASLAGPPAPLKISSQGRIYSLEIHQQPQRARMCGFGDKDRRPITPPPCVRLRIYDAITQQQLDVNEIDISYFILTVDLWSADGTKEVNLVRHSATSPSISAATATSYPPSHDGPASFSSPGMMGAGGGMYPGAAAAYGAPPQVAYGAPQAGGYGMPRQNELSRHMEIAQQASREEAIRIQHEQQQMQGQPLSSPNVTNKGQQGHRADGSHVMHPSTQAFLNGGAGSISAAAAAAAAGANGMYPATAQPQPGVTYAQSSMLPSNQLAMNVVDPRSQPGGMFTRNLIGSLAVGAFKLTYPEKDQGIWFILQDLSVRTEGSFRLKLNFVDVGAPAAAGVAAAAAAAAAAAQTSSSSSSSPTNASAAGLQAGKLNTSSAPVLASCYSDAFQVFSAKRFPGVKESTELSKAFAKQGIKIPIRKDGAGGGRGNERRDWDDDE